MSVRREGNMIKYGVTGGDEKDENITVVSADEVLPGLWIGNQASSQNVKWLDSKGIKTVINATKHLPFVGGRVGIRIPVNDPGPFNDLNQEDVATMYRALPCAVDMLHHSLGKGAVLVHCHAGMQRSAAVITGYLAKYYFHNLDNPAKGGDGQADLSNDKAVNALFEKSRNFLHKKRAKVFYQNWYVNFEKAIKQYIKNGMVTGGNCGRDRNTSPK